MNATQNNPTETQARAAFTFNDDGTVRYGLRTVRDVLGRDPHASTPSNLADEAREAADGGRPYLAALLYLAAACASAGMSRTLMYEESARRLARTADADAARNASTVARFVATDTRDQMADTLAEYFETRRRAAATQYPQRQRDLDARTLELAARVDAMNEARTDLDARDLNNVLQFAREDEAAILSRMVADALALGCSVSVWDGEAWPLRQSRDAFAILAACASTGLDNLKFRDASGAILGTVAFIYGNGCDVISDYTTGAGLAPILAGAEALAARLSGSQS